jgi:hypothetical protein
MPAWANNPGTFATTTKPDESQHKTVFELFGSNTSDDKVEKADQTTTKTDTKL